MMKCTHKCYMHKHMNGNKHVGQCEDSGFIMERFCATCGGGAIPGCDKCDDKGYIVLKPVLTEHKPFDISAHEWNDPDINNAVVKNSSIFVGFRRNLDYTVYTKPDIIAMARAIGVNGGDL